MPKRKQDDFFDLLVSVFSVLPWWIPFATALVVWQGLPPLGRAAVHQPAWHSLWPLLGAVVGGLIAITGVVAQFEKTRRGRLHAVEKLQELSWREFEQFCAEVFRRRGFAVEETATGADGGVDLILRRTGETTYVQCKHRAIRPVDVRVVRELFGVVAAEGATWGLVASSGSFTDPARQFSTKHGRVKLVDGEALLKLRDSTVASSAGRHRVAR
jgi:restriction system protein